MGLNLQVVMVSKKLRATLYGDGGDVVVYGYRTCGRYESHPSRSLHDCYTAQEKIAERAEAAVERVKPRYLFCLGLETIESKDGRDRRVFGDPDGVPVYEVENGKNCPVTWWDTEDPPSTKCVGFLDRTKDNFWRVVPVHVKICNSSKIDENGNVTKSNLCIQYLDQGNIIRSRGHWMDADASRFGEDPSRKSPC